MVKMLLQSWNRGGNTVQPGWRTEVLPHPLNPTVASSNCQEIAPWTLSFTVLSRGGERG
jgi:hypothetical protein